MTPLPSDFKVLECLENHPDGLTTGQMSIILGYTPRTIRQVVYRLRKLGYRVNADRVFRLRDAVIIAPLLSVALQTVLLSVKPIKYLCVYSTHKRAVEDFATCANQVQLLGTEFRISYTERRIITPRGSHLIFQTLSRDFSPIQGIEISNYWIENGHPYLEELTGFLEARKR